MDTPIYWATRTRWEFERKSIEREFAKKPANTENLTKWGEALLNLSQWGYCNKVSLKVNEDAITKLGKAVEMGPTNHEALFTLGNAHSAYAFVIDFHDRDAAIIEFQKALKYMQKADELCPGKPRYVETINKIDGLLKIISEKPALDSSAKAKHKNYGVHEVSQQTFDSLSAKGELASHKGTHIYDGESAASARKRSEQMKKSDFKYDVFGGVIFAAGLVALILMAK